MHIYHYSLPLFVISLNFLNVVSVVAISCKMNCYSAICKDESVLEIALWGPNPAAYCVITAFQSLVMCLWWSLAISGAVSQTFGRQERHSFTLWRSCSLCYCRTNLYNSVTLGLRLAQNLRQGNRTHMQIAVFGGLCLLKTLGGVINPAWLLHVRLCLFVPVDLVVPVQMWAYALFPQLVPVIWHHLSGCHTPIFQPISFHCRMLSRCLTFVWLERKGNHFLHCWALLWHIILGQTLSHSEREKGIKSNSLQLDMQGNQSVYDTAGLCRKANIKREIYSSFQIIGMACDEVYTIQ